MSGTEIRYNAMKIDSLAAFGDIRGRRAGNVRNVYFVRAEGICADYEEQILRLDKKLSSDSGCIYRRLTSFPVMLASEADFYGSAAERILSGAGRSILKKSISTEIEKSISEGVRHICGEIKAVRKDYTPTMEKNTAAYMLFALESVSELISGGGQAKKLVCSGETGLRAYSFCLLCTALGVDVCLLCPEKTPCVPEPLLERSSVFKPGSFGKIHIPEFKPCELPEAAPKVRKLPTPEITAVRPAAAENAQPCSQRRELSFEELARLAVSVVMIAVHDRRGDIVSTGSGIAISRSGYILTNCHVASGGRMFSVRLENEDKIFKTKEIIKYNPDLDMAVIRIDRELEPLKMYSGNSLARGQRVVAIGSPMGMFNSVSDGIISGFRRVEEMDMIQFTAPISGGSSGGALLNMYGEVIGMSTAGIEGGQNLNLAVSAGQIIPFIGGFAG